MLAGGLENIKLKRKKKTQLLCLSASDDEAAEDLRVAVDLKTSAAALKQLDASEQLSDELVSHFHEEFTRTGRSRRSPGSSRKPRGMRCMASSAMPISFGAPVLLHVVGPIF